ncbi:hypothetical protein [Clostridium sp. ZS2-4]|uniref:hypothetical protein n=1 Tax=Clostridium sp. ZS2-4 TaxID=2987703 RepID=UPI00227B73AC|nr:hypothetical protein [Clostridium sp. ZS2-4]MCY6356273.1 hypothetical protein [Clostridium sp. ZS2-4]
MNNKLEINISDSAYRQLKTLLLSHSDEYSCIKLSYSKTCCKNPSIEIILDDLENKENYITQTLKDITFIYNYDVVKSLKKIELIYSNSSFMIKIIPLNTSFNNCSNCESDCKGCKH